MANYSKADRDLMKAAFAKIFKVQPEYMEADPLREYMENAPIVIVEYDGFLQGESPAGRDDRMEFAAVYDGNISQLVQYLRGLYPDYQSLSKWELVFKICDGILAASRAIEQARSQTVFGKEETAGVAPQTNEEQLSGQSSSTEESQNIEEPRKEEVLEEASSFMNPPVDTQADRTEQNPEPVHTVQPTEEVSTPSGNVQPQDEVTPLSNKSIIKENKVMAENKEDAALNALLNAAESGTPDAGSAQVTPKKSNIAKKDNSEAKARVVAMLSEEKEVREAWTRQNEVSAIVTTQQPAALRVLAQTGIAVKGDDATEQAKSISEKMQSFVVGVTGRSDMTVDMFETLPDDQKYANLTKAENVFKAKQMYDLMKQIKQNPLMEVPAYIDPSKVSYPVKGLVLGGVAMPADDAILEIVAHSNVGVYGVGSQDANGHDVGEKPVRFDVALASKKKESNQAQGITPTTAQVKTLVLRPRNKKEFLKDASHIVFLFTKLDEKNEGKATFKALINDENGNATNACVSVFKLDANGQKIVSRKNQKTGEVTYKSKVLSLNVSVPVSRIVKEFAAEFKTDEDTLVIAQRWGLKMTTAKQKGNLGDLAEFSAAPIVDVFSAIYSGTVTLTSKQKGLDVIKTIRAAADQQAEEEAAQTAGELN